MGRVDRNKTLVRHMIKSGLIKSQKDLGHKLGYENESAFSQVINLKTAEPKDFVLRLKNIEPKLNEHWLLTGEGTMLNDNPERTTPDPPPAKRKGCPSIDEMVERMEEILGMLEQERSTVAEQKKTITMQEQTIQNERKEKQSLLEIIKHMVGGGYKSGDNMV